MRKRRARGPLGLADLAAFAPVTVYAEKSGWGGMGRLNDPWPASQAEAPASWVSPRLPDLRAAWDEKQATGRGAGPFQVLGR